jgi:REP element-mobilizing transposase RayT
VLPKQCHPNILAQNCPPARAARRYEVGVVAFSFLANHYHLLLQVQDADQLASFMSLFNSKLAREVARLTGWKDKIWSRRYQAIVISTEETAQTARLFYVLSNGVKENLEARQELHRLYFEFVAAFREAAGTWLGYHLALGSLKAPSCTFLIGESPGTIRCSRTGCPSGQGGLP